MRVPHGSTILVADGRKRLIARNTGTADAPALEIVGAAEEATGRTREIATDAAGRAPGGAGGHAGGAAVSGADPQAQDEERFAIETAALLRKGVEDGSYEQLIIVAAPATLGVLRKHFHAMVADRIIGEVGKDFTGRPVDAIGKMLIAQ